VSKWGHGLLGGVVRGAGNSKIFVVSSSFRRSGEVVLDQIIRILDVLAIITWLGGGNYVFYKSIKRQGLPLSYYFAPFSVLKRNDWLKILGLLALSFTIEIIRFNISK
jgi:hypothetical protein